MTHVGRDFDVDFDGTVSAAALTWQYCGCMMTLTDAATVTRGILGGGISWRAADSRDDTETTSLSDETLPVRPSCTAWMCLAMSSSS